MGAVLTGMAKFENGMRAVLLRGGNVTKGQLFQLPATLEEDELWLLRLCDPENERHIRRDAAIALRPTDTVFTRSVAPCFACAGKRLVGDAQHLCSTCFDGYL